jgi:negative regulator of genetic competence, sporulation and motility
MAMSKFSKSTAALPHSVREKPTIPFVSKVKNIEKVDGTDADKSEWIKLEFLMNTDNPAWGSKYSRQLAIFKDGCPEDWIKWVMTFREIENLMPMKEPAEKTRMFRTLLKGQDLYYFEHHLMMRRLEAEDSDEPDNQLIELVLRDCRFRLLS